MVKKRIEKLILSFFVSLGAVLFLNVSNNNDIVSVQANELVDTPIVSWNNIDYSHEFAWVPNTNSSGIPQEGYCLLALYPENIGTTSYTEENLLHANIVGCNVGDHILINGVNANEVDELIIHCYPENGLFLYIPQSSVAFSDEYEYVTVEVLEGMSIDGSAETVSTRFEYRGLLGSHGNWQVNPAPIEKIKGEFVKIDWNNRDYSVSTATGLGWCGELNSNGSPENGYCLLAFFAEEGKSYSDSIIGDVTTTGRGVIGQGLDVDHKVKVNGVDIVDVEGALCYIYPAYGLYFYLPEESLNYDETYHVPTIEMEAGIHFNNVYLPHITFEFRGEIGELNCWTYLKDYSEYNKYEFTGVAPDWNNVPVDDTHNHSVLQFGENTPEHIDYLKNDKTSDETNLVNRSSDCGTKITINGIPLCEIEDSLVSYAHGYGYFYILLPLSVLSPSNGYKIVTLHIEEDTVFYDTLLVEVNLYLFNGRWIITKPETPQDSDYDNVLSFSSTFMLEEATLDKDNKELSAVKECSIDSFGLFIDYKIQSGGDFALYALGNKKQSGLKLVFTGSTISLFDSTQGSLLLSTAELEIFKYDEWFSLLFYTRVVDNNLSIFVAVDDITYIHVDEVNLSNKNNIGSQFSINLGEESASFKNAVLGADNKKPTLNYNGKYVYSVLSNSEVIDFSNKCSSFDVVDGNVSSLIEYNWPEGSISDNKINKGVWEVVIVASDKSNNKTMLSVTVIAADKLDVTVTFDGKNPVNYRVGDHIAAVEDPVKDGEGNVIYRFIGWYYNDQLWDFENDYVTSDMNLVSKFQATAEEHCVSFIVEGLEGVKSYNLYFAHGTKLNLSYFEKEGYSLKAYVDDNEVESITINQNISVKLVYTSNNPQNTTKGCGGNIISNATLLSIISGAALILLVVLKKKGGKEHE